MASALHRCPCLPYDQSATGDPDNLPTAPAPAPELRGGGVSPGSFGEPPSFWELYKHNVYVQNTTAVKLIGEELQETADSIADHTSNFFNDPLDELGQLRDGVVDTAAGLTGAVMSAASDPLGSASRALSGTVDYVDRVTSDPRAAAELQKDFFFESANVLTGRSIASVADKARKLTRLAPDVDPPNGRRRRDRDRDNDNNNSNPCDLAAVQNDLLAATATGCDPVDPNAGKVAKPAKVEVEAPVKAGDTGTYGDLKGRKRRIGETEALDMDHQPSFAAQRKAAEDRLNRKLTSDELKALKNGTPAVASPRKIHKQTSPTYGGRNTAARIAEDAADLDAAALRDRLKFDEAMRNR